ncbi:MAG: fibronectin type III domain-containing protein [Akkermansiaceae bacterium]
MKSALFMVIAATLPLFGGPPQKLPGAEEGMFHQVQRGEDGKLVLNATNGFFDKGRVRATGQRAGDDDWKEFIKVSFSELEFLPGKESASAKWYLWSESEGKVTLRIAPGKGFGEMSKGESWSVGVRGLEREFYRQFDGRVGEQAITIPLVKGRQVVVIEREGKEVKATGIKSLTLSGDHVKDLALLRARWRPAAIHTRYHAKGCPEPVAWIFESRSSSRGSSYSPMTTNFGYFGAIFGADQRAAGGVNFSMWALSQKGAKGKLPPLEQMPHLLATGNPEAEFSGFGHEGSGVKIRNWTPYAHQPKSVIQALRVEENGMYHTYYGYLFDDVKQQWVLYATGNKVPRKNTRATVRASSFCEVPGPPQVERTGDIERVLDRRGWFVDEAGKIFQADRMTTKAKFQNHGIETSADHWFRMTTGGVAFRETPGEVTLNHRHEIPVYLQPEVLKGIYRLPAEIVGSQLIEAAPESATVSYEIEEPGTKARGMVWYGQVNAMTFTPRKLHGTERGRVSEDLFAKDRLWAASSKAQELAKGENRFHLKNLKPGTKYFYRLLVKNEEGKCWAEKSGSFTTRKVTLPR